jgi:serine/threonine-protein kinase HSL1 (negative regulator of Swe1 kinase)
MHLYDVWSSETELYLVLEYIEGGELFDYLCSKGRRLHILEAVSIIKQARRMTIASRQNTYCTPFV